MKLQNLILQVPLYWGGCQVPRNTTLERVIGTKNTKLIHKAEQSYILQLCAVPSGVDMLLIVNGICAHHGQHVDLARVRGHVWELTQRGILERFAGRYRVKPDVVEHLQQMIADEAGRARIRTT